MRVEAAVAAMASAADKKINLLHNKNTKGLLLLLPYPKGGQAAQAIVAQLAERRLPKPQVAGSNPVCRSLLNKKRGRNTSIPDLFLFPESAANDCDKNSLVKL